MTIINLKYFTKFYLALGLIAAIISIGIIGFMFIEDYTFLEAFYMTIITIATVGFQEVHPLTEEGRLFTALLIITSFGTFAYAITAITKYVVEGEFNYYYKFPILLFHKFYFLNYFNFNLFNLSLLTSPIDLPINLNSSSVK